MYDPAVSSPSQPCLVLPAELAELSCECEAQLELRQEVEYERCGCRSTPGAAAQLMLLDLSPGQKVKISQNHTHPGGQEAGQEDSQETEPTRLCHTVRGARGHKGPKRLCDPRPDVLLAGNTKFGVIRGFSQQQQALIIKVER